MPLIVFATCLRQPETQPSDLLLAAELEAHGARVVAAPWNGDFALFAEAEITIIRSTWDYPENVPAFEAWLHRLQQVRGQIFNSPALMRWNLSKQYLVDLAKIGAPLPPTLIVDRTPEAIAGAMEELGLRHAVVKPIYGGTSRGLSVVERGDQAGVAAAAALLAHPAMVQAVIPEIAEGETSILFLGGEFSHAVVKRPRSGDIRSQREFGGTIATVSPPLWAIKEAEGILALLPEPAPYARVDVVLLDGRLWLMEVEVIEPELFLNHDSAAAPRLANLLINELRA